MGEAGQFRPPRHEDESPVPLSVAPPYHPLSVPAQGLCTAVLEVSQALAVEKFDSLPQLGRFTLRDGTRTIAIGKVLRLGIPKSEQAAYLKATGGAGGKA